VCGYLVRDDYSAQNVLDAVRLCGILKEAS